MDQRDVAAVRARLERAIAARDTDGMINLLATFPLAVELMNPSSDLRRTTERRAAGGDSDAMYLLGFLYEQLMEPPDRRRAQDWYERAGAAGNVDAMFNLGNVLIDMDPPDLRGAQDWYERAAAAGDAGAMYSLGLLLARKMDPPDLAGARYWCERAAAAGNAHAKRYLHTLAEGARRGSRPPMRSKQSRRNRQWTPKLAGRPFAKEPRPFPGKWIPIVMTALAGLITGIAAFSRGDTTAGIIATVFAILTCGAGMWAVIRWALAAVPDMEGFVPALSSLVLAPVLVGIGSFVAGHWVVGLAAVVLGATMVPLGAALIRGKTLAFGASGVAAIGIGIWVLVDGNLLGGTALIGIGGVVVFVGGVIGFVRSRSW